MLEILKGVRPDYQERLASAGYNIIGDGYASDVYAKEGDPFVLKVFSDQDFAYKAFYKVAHSNPNNPHFPRFKGKMMRINNDSLAVRIERLTPYVGDDQTLWDVKTLIWGFQTGNAVRLASDVDQQLIAACKAIGDAAQNVIHKHGRQRKAGIDMKRENVMMRGETLVLIDPIN